MNSFNRSCLAIVAIALAACGEDQIHETCEYEVVGGEIPIAAKFEAQQKGWRLYDSEIAELNGNDHPPLRLEIQTTTRKTDFDKRVCTEVTGTKCSGYEKKKIYRDVPTDIVCEMTVTATDPVSNDILFHETFSDDFNYLLGRKLVFDERTKLNGWRNNLYLPTKRWHFKYDESACPDFFEDTWRDIAAHLGTCQLPSEPSSTKGWK